MNDLIGQKNNVVLSDYNYRRDIENRLFMGNLSLFEVDVLREIVDGSLKFTIKQLASHLDVPDKKLQPVLKKIATTSLIQIQGENVTVDKETRRYFESEIIKFEDSFEPNMDFLQGLLSKAPIHALPNWYAISGSSQNIFNSIVETFLKTPKTYERYLSALKFKDPLMHEIMHDLFSHPNYAIPSSDLIKKYGFSEEKFEEMMLLFEFNFVCCLGYERLKDRWQQVVVPFAEWHSYLLFLKESRPKTIADAEEIKRAHPQDFGFVRDVAALVQVLQQQKVILKSGLPTKAEINQIWPNLNEVADPKEHLENIFQTVIGMDLGVIAGNALQMGSYGVNWLAQNTQEKSLHVYAYRMQQIKNALKTYSEKDLREAERALKRVAHDGWVYFDDFMEGCTAHVGAHPMVFLHNKGKKWKYLLPEYTEEDCRFIRDVFAGPLFEAGLVAVGEHKKRFCLCVTPFGRMTLGL